MKINKNNYEEFFLLYADGELSAAESNAVEEFAATDPTLMQELALLIDCRLDAGAAVMEDKGDLLKPVPVDAAVLENLLLEIDEEPIHMSAAEFELLLKDKNVKAEFDLLRRTRLNTDEKIIFARKDSLYRKKPRRIVLFYYAAAAVVIGLTVLFGLNVLTPADNLPIARGNDLEIPRPLTSAAGGKRNNSDTVRGGAAMTSIKERPNVTVDSKRELRVEKENKPSKAFEPGDEYEPNEKALIAKVIDLAPAANTADVAKKRVTKEITELDIPSLAKADLPADAAYKMAVALRRDEDDGNKILYMDEDDVKQSRAGGMVKKLKSFVERTANIKPGKSLLIAGFEFRGNKTGRPERNAALETAKP